LPGESAALNLQRRRGTLSTMTPREIIERQKQLAAEMTAIVRQLEPIDEFRTIPGPLGPAELERQLDNRWVEIEAELYALSRMLWCGKLPPGYQP
jgi:hypothetical protein